MGSEDSWTCAIMKPWAHKVDAHQSVIIMRQLHDLTLTNTHRNAEYEQLQRKRNARRKKASTSSCVNFDVDVTFNAAVPVGLQVCSDIGQL